MKSDFIFANSTEIRLYTLTARCDAITNFVWRFSWRHRYLVFRLWVILTSKTSVIEYIFHFNGDGDATSIIILNSFLISVCFTFLFIIFLFFVILFAFCISFRDEVLCTCATCVYVKMCSKSKTLCLLCAARWTESATKKLYVFFVNKSATEVAGGHKALGVFCVCVSAHRQVLSRFN